MRVRALAGLGAFLWLGSAAAADPFPPSPWLNFNMPPQALEAHCAGAKDRAGQRLAALAAIPGPSRDFTNTPANLDRILWDLGDETASDTFLKEVSISSETREASRRCQTLLEKFYVDVYTREDLFNALKSYQAGKPALAGEAARLVEKELLDYKRNGLLLPPKKREEVRRLHERLVDLEQAFEKNIAEVKDFLLFTRAELEGLPADYVARLPREGDRYRVGLDYPDYFPFMENAKDPEARRRLEALFDSRAARENLPLLREILDLRRQAARLLGYRDHASYVLEERMAKTPKAARKFLSSLEKKLKVLARPELEQLLALKRQEEGRGSDGILHAWDWRYYHNRLKQARYQIDPEAIKEYFPLDGVTAGMFSVYERLLGVRFRKIEEPVTWHPEASLYEVTDASGPLLGYFYMDLFPREGKYKHAAAFDLVKGRRLKDGRYQPPVSAIVANFNRPSGDRPALLKHGEHEEVETFFHEFGHIMHQVLTKAAFGRFSGSSVARDFVEAPSQMLENWVWDPAVLALLSGHYQDRSRKLPKDLLERMVAAKNLDTGLMNLRQVFFATADLDYHSASGVDDTTAHWRDLMERVSLIPMTPGTSPEASFGHLVGYDAGYYGYLWSKVFAQDMFSRFEAQGPLDAELGRRYRREILEPGSSREEGTLLRAFLGREPNDEAFLKSIGLTPRRS